MKRLFLITVLFISLSGICFAQSARDLIDQNPDRAANNLHSYEFEQVVDTPAPKGYKPFYISHYGRHGSRYEQNTSFSKQALDGLNSANEAGILSEKGKALLGYINTITDEHKGKEGSLSPRGALEHRTIAKRMASRFPDIFKSRTREDVRVFASTSPRCIISMANFTNSLKEEFPKINYTYTSADKYMVYLGPSFDYGAVFKNLASQGSAQRMQPASQYDFSRIYRLIFTDPAKASELIHNQEQFVRSIYSTGQLCQDLDFLGIDIFREYFTTDELHYLWQQGNDTVYLLWGNSIEGGESVRKTITPLLKDIVEKADESLVEGSTRNADLRFGHDTGVLPLFALIGVDDQDGKRYPFDKAHQSWYSFMKVPMATNFQLVFYKNKKGGDILCKLLYNEKETLINGLTPVSGPYYRWSELRSYFISRYVED